MTSQAGFVSAVDAHGHHRLSFWRRLFEAIVAGRQHKAHQYMAEFLERHEEYQDRYTIGRAKQFPAQSADSHGAARAFCATRR
jgi:DNA-binding FadR family transcriptional regulator